MVPSRNVGSQRLTVQAQRPPVSLIRPCGNTPRLVTSNGAQRTNSSKIECRAARTNNQNNADDQNSQVFGCPPIYMSFVWQEGLTTWPASVARLRGNDDPGASPLTTTGQLAGQTGSVLVPPDTVLWRCGGVSGLGAGEALISMRQ